jgi:hypothetical protein
MQTMLKNTGREMLFTSLSNLRAGIYMVKVVTNNQISNSTILVFCINALPQNDLPVWPENPPDDWMTYHLAHPGPGPTEPGDPNAAIYFNGRYHMHYISQNSEGHAFAHVSSEDMLFWKWHETVLTHSFTGHGMYSGTAFLTKAGQPAVIYHGQGSGRNQLIFAQDDSLNSWSVPEAVRSEDISCANMFQIGNICRCFKICNSYHSAQGERPCLTDRNFDSRITVQLI